ncbi:hypothetical protein QR680_011005 [Steinernema hermaphroditum]|uniref:Uncharacterized protein n=1 Tax=Steinernema hermaphroditum TaxID=289476 RepID=A0AA39MBL2_9BILA|nr:hypothetical protein QR680_011005 [Steinernema hermaphroditum]
MAPFTAVVSYLIVSFDLFLEAFLLYMIIFRSPHSMRTFRIYLGVLCLNSTALSVVTGFIWQPEFTTHPICIHTEGIFKSFLSNRLMSALSGALMVQHIQLLLSSYIYVYSKMNYFSFDLFTRRRAIWNVVFVLVPAIVFGIIVYHSNSSDSYAKHHVPFKLNGFVSPVCYFVADLKADGLVNYAIGFIFIYIITFISVACYLLLKVHKKLKNPPSTTAPKTIQLQRMFFTNVLIQSLIPQVLVSVPIVVAIGYEIIGHNRLGSVLFKISIMSVSLHSLVSCCLVLWVTKPYRRELLLMLHVKKPSSKDTLAMTVGMAVTRMRRKDDD